MLEEDGWEVVREKGANGGQVNRDGSLRASDQ